MNTMANTRTIHQLLDSQVQCVLSTQSEGGPSQHLMAYAFEPWLERVYIATHVHTEKAANMLQNASVSLLWDNRTGSTTDHEGGLALLGQAQASPLHGWLRARARHLLQARNPELAALLRQEGCVAFALDIESFRLARGYSVVETVRPGNDEFRGHAPLARAS